MTVDRMLPSREAADLLDLTRQLAERELAPRVTEAEATGTFPAEVFKLIGAAGLLGLPYPESLGGGGQPYEVYLQVLEELAMRWAAVAVTVSVHGLSCFPLATFGTPEQQERWLPDLLGGGMLGAYSLSEPQAGSDAAALACQAERDGGGYVITGTKAWITGGGNADSYTLFARTAPGSQGVSCFLVRRPARAVVRAAGAEDGAAGGADDQRPLRRCAAARRPPDRRRGAGAADRVQRAGLRAARHRGRRDRAGPGRPGLRGRLREGAADVRPADHRPRGPGVSCSRTWPPRSARPGRPTWTRPGAGTPGAPTASRPAWPS